MTKLPNGPRPVLKWAGGKAQLIAELDDAAPAGFGRYIEPFVGGGAYFFHLSPQEAVLGDCNAELMNLYRCIAADAEAVAAALGSFALDEEAFYEVRSQDWTSQAPTLAAARMLYLNRLCFNGLYRVNKKGQFNVPIGSYKNPKLPTLEALVATGAALSRATLVEADYKALLRAHAAPGDFVFLDPPYLPVSEYSDFKRYTATQFRESDHRELAAEVVRLAELGCHVLLTNSNHPLVHELYGEFEIRIVETRRNISSRAASRRGQDVIVKASPVDAGAR